MRAFEVFSLSHRNEKMTNWLQNNQIGLEKRITQEAPELISYWAARMELHHAIEELENGAIFPTQFMWFRVTEEENSVLRRHRSHLAEAMIDMMDSRLRRACEEREISRLEHFLTISREILETVPENVYRPDVHRFSIRVIAAHALCGQNERLG